jgi:tRNA G18 (ribose-2'-O)-methylase SpoU
MDELNRKTVEEFKRSDKNPVAVVLDNVRSMHNVGSVFRTSDAFLIASICLCGYTPRPPHRDIHKTALGATETVHWAYYSSATEAVYALKKQGYAVWAVEQTEGSMALGEINWATLTSSGAVQRIAVVFGNEVGGVDAEVLKLCEGCIEIPQSGTKHSLNIAVAAGIVLWELVKLVDGTVKTPG